MASEDPVRESKDEVLKQQEQDLKWGVKSINEVRGERGLEPVAWGNVPWLPLDWKPTDRHIFEQVVQTTTTDQTAGTPAPATSVNTSTNGTAKE